MSMNIKSAEAHKLARQLAALEDTTVTDAVTMSLREALARRRAYQITEARLEKMRQLADTFATLEREDPGAHSLWEVNANLHDEQGLPR
jgi:antitoxin VapB